MKEIKFTKMSGAGNDFIVIDNYNKKINLTASQIEKICRRRFSVGADGLIMIEKSFKNYDFYMRFFNNDGKEAEMCGNGGRCAARFAYLKKYAKKSMEFLAKDGPHKAVITGKNIVKLKMIEPYNMKLNIKLKIKNKSITGHYLNTGVPHFVIFVNNLEKFDIFNIGREIRFHKFFAPKGTNVNFIQKINNLYFIRTYERGVEAETYACGTGATAAAIIINQLKNEKSPIILKAKGGLLKIYFKKDNTGYIDVWLEGPANIIYEGKLNKEATM
ncbi:MAG: diaminopimelate epimerase [Candidatus Goldbacteria bacterium]|nr:diaminopimelate epimerase [Candidatus Goldiibacteriota bacterium]